MPDKEHVAKIVAAFARGNTLGADQLPDLITTVHDALSTVGAPEPAEPIQPVKFVPAVPVRRSIQPNSITCLDCGVEKKSLKRHLATAHGLTPDTYRLRWHGAVSSPSHLGSVSKDVIANRHGTIPTMG